MNTRTLLVAFGVAACLLACGSGASGKQQSMELRDKRITIQMDGKPLFDVFRQLMNEYDIAIGFEESTLDREDDDYRFTTNIRYDPARKPDGSQMHEGPWRPGTTSLFISLDYQNARLEDVMNRIVKQMKNYSWEINDDVIDIFPNRGRDPIFQQLMELRIAKFTLNAGVSIFNLKYDLTDVPEFKAFVADKKLFSNGRQEVGYRNRCLPDGAEFSDLSFRELLNRITKIKRGGWIVRANNDGTAIDVVL